MDSKFITGTIGIIVALILIMFFFEHFMIDTKKTIKRKVDYPEEFQQTVEKGDILIVDSIDNKTIYLSYKR